MPYDESKHPRDKSGKWSSSGDQGGIVDKHISKAMRGNGYGKAIIDHDSDGTYGVTLKTDLETSRHAMNELQQHLQQHLDPNIRVKVHDYSGDTDDRGNDYSSYTISLHDKRNPTYFWAYHPEEAHYIANALKNDPDPHSFENNIKRNAPATKLSHNNSAFASHRGMGDSKTWKVGVETKELTKGDKQTIGSFLDRVTKAYNPDEERDDKGQWTAGEYNGSPSEEKYGNTKYGHQLHNIVNNQVAGLRDNFPEETHGLSDEQLHRAIHPIVDNAIDEAADNGYRGGLERMYNHEMDSNGDKHVPYMLDEIQNAKSD